MEGDERAAPSLFLCENVRKETKKMNLLQPVLIEDLNEICSPSGLQYSPSGDTLAFTLVKPDQKSNSYQKNLWIMSENSKVTQLTTSDREGSFIWDDNNTILFISDRNSDGGEEKDDLEEKTTFYRIDIRGGEAKKAFSVSKSVSFFKKISDGLYCMGIEENRNALPDDADKKAKKEEKDYHVIDEVPLWGNGRGFISGVRTSLYLYDEKTASFEKLTPANFDTASVCVKEDMLLILGKEWTNVIDETDSLLLYKLADKKLTILIEQGKLLISRAVFAGKTIILTATDMKPYGDGQYHDIYEYDLVNQNLTKTVTADCLIGVDILTDCHYSSGESLVVSNDATIYAIAQRSYKDTIVSYQSQETENILSDIYAFNGLVCELASGNNRLSFAAMEANGCCEIYEYKNGAVTKRTSFNDAYLSTHFVSKAKKLSFVNKDGVTIDGWVLEPKDYDPTKSYPGVLEIHGGPRCAYGEVFFHEMQVWASKGWFVFFCNPRGSEGYGEEFADLRGKYGTIDYQDLMEFTDQVLAQYPQIDQAKVGAAGGSYGGFMCNWIEGHTDRFAALASQRSVSNWVSDFGCSEIGVTFDQNEILATPWTNMEAMWDCSPLKFACNAKTPILFIHSMNDYNCTLDQGIQMFTAVKFYGVPARMCLFEGENHGLSRRGKPLHRMRRLKEMTDWFVTYLNN